MPVAQAHHADVGESAAGGFATGAAPAQSAVSHEFVVDALGCGEGGVGQCAQFPPRLQAFETVPGFGGQDAALAQGTVDVGGCAMVVGGVAAAVGVEAFAAADPGPDRLWLEHHSAFFRGLGAAGSPSAMLLRCSSAA